jgi:hypothetical protein
MKMMNKSIQLLTLLVFTFFVSCIGDDNIPVVKPGSSDIIFSGAESGIIDFTEVSFDYYLISRPTVSQSDLSVRVGNVDKGKVLLMQLFDSSSSQGFKEDSVYNYQPNQNDPFSFNVAFFTADNSYDINPEATEANWIRLTKILDTEIEGEFEANVENNNGDKVKLTGTFLAIGKIDEI